MWAPEAGFFGHEIRFIFTLQAIEESEER